MLAFNREGDPGSEGLEDPGIQNLWAYLHKCPNPMCQSPKLPNHSPNLSIAGLS